MTYPWIIAGLVVALAGCAGPLRAPPAEAPPAPRTAGAETPRPADRPVAAPAPAGTPAPAGSLGRTVASLGNPAEGGLWLVTGLVSQATPGVVRDVATGATLRLELRPSGGAVDGGGRLSLDGLRGLGLGPTALPVLEVSRE